MADVLVGIDLGTSGIRVAAYAKDGTVLASGDARLAGQTTTDWLAALREAMPDLPDGDVLCAIDSTSGTVVACDRTGDPVTDPMVYNDRAPAAAADLEVADDAGIPLGPTAPLVKLVGFRDRSPAPMSPISSSSSKVRRRLKTRTPRSRAASAPACFSCSEGWPLLSRCPIKKRRSGLIRRNPSKRARLC